MTDAVSEGLTLYNWPTSTCSQKVRMVLAEKALPFVDHRLDSSRSENLSDWYLKLNENGVVPTLKHGSRVVIDSTVINEYLEDVFPRVPLVPTDVYRRARMERRTVRKHFYRHMGRSGSSADEERDAIEKLRETIVRMERALEHGPWIVGEEFTLADVGLIPTIVRMSDIGLADAWDKRPHVAGWFERMQARPSFAKTFYPGSRYGAAGSHPAVEQPAC
jgi:glutathione S-transferase